MKLKSDNSLLEIYFEKAVKKTAQFVVTGTKSGEVNKGDGGKWHGPDGVINNEPTEEWAKPKDYIPSYWAGYFDRTAFYIRDFVHQAVGAHFLGLDEENYQMLSCFVNGACEDSGWFAPWAYNFDGTIYYLDTPSFSSFVRELTAQYELVELICTLYRLTDDKRYLEKPFLDFCNKILGEFTESQDTNGNGIPEGKGDIWKGCASYNERGVDPFEAGDSIAALYSARKSYAELLNISGKTDEAKIQQEKATQLKAYFNNTWSCVDGTEDYCFITDKRGKKYHRWEKNGNRINGGASLIFIPLKELSEQGERNNRLLDYIYECETNEKLREDNIESYTYLPDMYFKNHQPDRAWHFMRYIMSQFDLPHERASQGTNGDYPEISFTFISQVICGMLGIDIKDGQLTVRPQLPSDIHYIELTDLLFKDKSIKITLEDSSVKISVKST